MKQKKTCVVCKIEYNTNTTHGGVRSKSTRPTNSLTCCRKHARYYRNVCRFLQYQYKAKETKL